MGDVILDARGARAWLELLAATLSEHAEELTGLDAAIGDADHGSNMDRGFKAVRQKALNQDGADPAAVFKQTGMALISTVGGAGGPLYGTFFLRMAQAATGKEQLTVEDLRDILKAGLEGVVQRGKASPGEKTMADARPRHARSSLPARGAERSGARHHRSFPRAASQRRPLRRQGCGGRGRVHRREPDRPAHRRPSCGGHRRSLLLARGGSRRLSG